MIADKIRKLRHSRNLSQAELARQLGKTRSYINSLEQSLSLPSLGCLVELSKFFCVSTDYLLGLSENTSIDTTGLSTEDIAIISLLVDRLNNEKE